MKQTIRIPKSKGSVIEETSKELEELLNIHIEINRDNLTIDGNDMNALKSKNVIEALTFGFNRDSALKLVNDNNHLRRIDINSYLPAKSSTKKAKGRIIGEEGKTKRLIKMYTGVELSIHKNNVCLIGPIKSIGIAEKAVTMLIKGKPHSRVYNYLEQNQ